MSTTSIKLTESLKARAAEVARQEGLSTHAFMVAAIEQATTQAEKRADFLDAADSAWAEVQSTGKAYAMEDVHRYIHDKLSAKQPSRPKAVDWRK